MKLRISETLALPLDFVTQTQAILAIKRVGKSYTASVQAEELLKAGQQIVAIDVTGAWWGLRSNAAGSGPGFPILIAGGDHGDIPLEENAGEVLAEAIVSERFGAIIDVSLFRKAQAQRFLAVFFETLYRKNRDAMHLFMDEADFYAPQKPFGEEARTLGAVNDIVRRGGIRGIGCTLITQRPAILNKDVLTMCGILTALRVSHPKDMASIMEWIRVHADPVIAEEMLKSLPSLPTGTAWMWSTAWPDDGGFFKKIKIRERETFNSGATPKAGQIAKSPKVIAEVDIAKLGQKISETAQRVKENDPKLLKQKIAELQKQLSAKTPIADESAVQQAVKHAIAQRDKECERRIEEIMNALSKMRSFLATIGRQAAELAGVEIPQAKTVLTSPQIPVRQALKPVATRPVANRNGTGEKLPPGERAVLIAAAQYQDGVERDQLSVLTGYKRSSRDAYILRLTQKSYISQQGNRLVATDAGIAALGSDYEPLPVGDDLRDYWLGRLPEGERKVLEVLIGSYPAAVPRDVLDERTGYKRSSRDAYIQRLGSRRLVEVCGRGEVKAADDLFTA